MLILKAFLCKGSGPVTNDPKFSRQEILPLTARIVGGAPLSSDSTWTGPAHLLDFYLSAAGHT